MYLSIVGWYDLRRDDLDYDLLKWGLNEWRRIKKYFFGDYYPLTPYSLYNDVRIAWQFDCPEEGEGVVQVFRRAENDEADKVRKVKLRGLEPQPNTR
jgi:alpha-galactosidase